MQPTEYSAFIRPLKNKTLSNFSCHFFHSSLTSHSSSFSHCLHLSYPSYFSTFHSFPFPSLPIPPLLFPSLPISSLTFSLFFLHSSNSPLPSPQIPLAPNLHTFFLQTPLLYTPLYFTPLYNKKEINNDCTFC